MFSFFLRQPADGPLFYYIGPLYKQTIPGQCLATISYTIQNCDLEAWFGAILLLFPSPLAQCGARRRLPRPAQAGWGVRAPFTLAARLTRHRASDDIHAALWG